jgi:membrane-associated phospholipid phosphatase
VTDVQSVERSTSEQRRDLIAGFVAAVAALVLFGWLAGQVWGHDTIRFDAAIRNGLHALASPALTYAFLGISWLGSSVFLLPFGAVVVWRLAARGRRRAAMLFVVAAVGGEALDATLKLAFHRPRPEVFFRLAQPATYSFPSGHAMVSACFFGALAAILTAREPSRAVRAAIWAGAAALSLAIGVSRIYLGMHYPSDVAGGYAAAVIWVMAVRAAYGAWLRRRNALAGR